MNKELHRWLRICFINLLIVSLLGILMRYKIAYTFPYLQQKFILHAHSHFAFAGWITQVIMTLMVFFLGRDQPDAFPRYRKILWANLITAYGMLLSFPFQGYGAISITFSTLNIFTGYWFAIAYWRSLNRQPQRRQSYSWFRAALVFNAISSLGAFFLAYMMGSKNFHHHWYLAAVYFFLHFQYNGWFFFGCMGMLTEKMERRGISVAFLRPVFLLFAAACIPAYFLSALWLPIPVVVYILVVAAAIAQVVAGVMLYKGLRRSEFTTVMNASQTGRKLVFLAGMALAIKLLLQLGSTIPSLSDLAFGFRPIVIGYLHLVLLAVITLFIVGYLFSAQLVLNNRGAVRGAWVFTAGIVLNEVLLMGQGIAAMSYQGVPFADLGLLIAGIVMFAGLLMMNLSLRAALPRMTDAG